MLEVAYNSSSLIGLAYAAGNSSQVISLSYIRVRVCQYISQFLNPPLKHYKTIQRLSTPLLAQEPMLSNHLRNLPTMDASSQQPKAPTSTPTTQTTTTTTKLPVHKPRPLTTVSAAHLHPSAPHGALSPRSKAVLGYTAATLAVGGVLSYFVRPTSLLTTFLSLPPPITDSDVETFSPPLYPSPHFDPSY